jgi:hypothetical protein
MTTNQRVIVENRDFTGRVTGTEAGTFIRYSDSDLVIKLDNGKTTYEKENCVFESIETYEKIVANRNNKPLIEKTIADYDDYDKIN